MLKPIQKRPSPPALEAKSSIPSPYFAEAFASFLAAVDQRARETTIEQWAQLQASNHPGAEAPHHEDLLTVEKTAELLNVVPQTIFSWRKAGILVGYSMGNRVYFKRSEVLAALRIQTAPDGRRKYARRQYEKKAR